MCLLDVIQEKRLHRVHFSGSIYSQEENNYIFATSPKPKKNESERAREIRKLCEKTINTLASLGAVLNS